MSSLARLASPLMASLRRNPLLSFSGNPRRKMFFGCCFGLPIATGVMYAQASVAHAVEDYHLDSGETTKAMMRSETNRFWALLRKIQLPVLLAFVLLYSRGHPIAVAVDFFLLLFCTRPNPLSIYIFIEELRQSHMNSHPSLYKTKLLYLKNVEVHDYKILCVAKVELVHRKLYVIGMLGEWFDFSF